MWYSLESFVALASFVLLTRGETVPMPSPLPAVVARVAACDAPEPSLPDSIQLVSGLEPIVRSWLGHSPTFRQQCRKLAAARRLRATVRVAQRPAGTAARAVKSSSGAKADVELIGVTTNTIASTKLAESKFRKLSVTPSCQ